MVVQLTKHTYTDIFIHRHHKGEEVLLLGHTIDLSPHIRGTLTRRKHRERSARAVRSCSREWAGVRTRATGLPREPKPTASM